MLAWGALSHVQTMGKLSTGAFLWGQNGSGLPCWATGLSGESQSQQPRHVVLEMVFNITWQESCPPPTLSVFQLLECSASLLCCLLQFLESHLLKAISSISAHPRGERELFGAVQHSWKLWCLWILFVSTAEMLWKGENCAADDNAEGCSGFCRAFSPFHSHSTVKQWDLVLFQCLGLLPEERSREAK